MPPATACTDKSKGFTLLEMSIVLVVIGLIVAAIVGGKSMIRQSQVMSVITDEQSYVAAAKNFQQKYGMLPGDFNGAQNLWGINTNCGTFGAGTGTQTCNGAGNGQVGNKAIGTATQNFETLLFWQHLANASLVSGSFSGSSANATTGYYSVPGTNVPLSKVRGGGFSFIYVGNQATDGTLTNWFAGSYGHVIELGAQDTTNNQETSQPLLTIGEAASIDSKIDDGLPGTGNVLTQMSGAYTCASTTNHSTAIYNITTTAVGPSQAACGLIFITGM